MRDEKAEAPGADSGRRDPSDPANDETDPGYWPAMIVLGLLFVVSVISFVRSLTATFGA
ncbi:MAG: hypothetical protein Q8W44_07720 [Candidatus Palauibacterales bacterium]|nr:hypothetical protein [Candidatus Palauibacterales bacterium]